MKLVDSLRQAGGSRLQDVGRLHFEDPIVRTALTVCQPARSTDRRRLHLLAAPRREDHLGIAPGDFGRIDDAILGEPRCASSGKIGAPPAIATSSSTHRMPEIRGSSHSSKNTRGRRGNRAADADGVEISREAIRKPFRLALAADQASNHRESSEEFRQRSAG